MKPAVLKRLSPVQLLSGYSLLVTSYFVVPSNTSFPPTAMAATSRTYAQPSQENVQRGTQEHAENADYLPIIFCRALYDYQAEDMSSLSFSRGDIIEVLTQLETGWWDGLLNGQRGWFPSNYVVLISAQEAEQELRANAEEGEWGQDSQEHIGPTNDFWMPQVTMDGRVSN